MAKSIRSAKNIISLIGENSEFYFSISADGLSEKLIDIGFNSPIICGDEVIPKPIGKYTEFNANGKEVIRKDLEKIFVHRMVWGTTRDWQGNTHSQLQNKRFEMYPREWMEAPEEALKIIQAQSKILVVSRKLVASSHNAQEIVHLANVFLELFGDYSLLNDAMIPKLSPVVRKLNWRILPPGEHPFANINDFVDRLTESIGTSEKNVANYRLSSILSYNPDFIAIGNGGFNGYIVMGFQEKNIFILESPIFGNATYIFRNDWESVSSLSKKEIIRGELHSQRLIHTRGWRSELHRLLS